MVSVPPGLILVLGCLLLPLLRGRWKKSALVALPVLSFIHLLFYFPDGTRMDFELFGYSLLPVHVDSLNLVWGYVFHIAACLSALYSLHVEDDSQHLAGLIYAGAAIGAVFAGDLLTLFLYWELTAVSSVFLIWATGTPNSYNAGMRYLVVQVGSGVLLLSGILMHYRDTGSLEFLNAFRELLPETSSQLLGLNSPGTALIFLAFGIKAAFPLLHAWLKDAYPQGTPTGTVFLSAFTTKLAIYALARGFPGTGILIWIGAAMTVIPSFYAVIENDLRRVLSYSLNNQLGYMVVGVGLADFVAHPDLAHFAINGTASHAFAHILYKSLLFMSMGAVLMRTGTAKASELGRPVQIDAVDGGILYRRRCIHFRTVVWRVRVEIHDRVGGCRSARNGHLADTGLGIGRCVSPHGNQDPVLCVLCKRFGQAGSGGTVEHAGRNGDRGLVVCVARHFLRPAVSPATLRGRLPAVYDDARDYPSPAFTLVRAGVYDPVPVGPVSGRTSLDQS